MQSYEHTIPGILPCQSIEALIAGGAITTETPFDADQVQPASLDLRLGKVAYRLRASFLPGQRKVLRPFAASPHRPHVRPVEARTAGAAGRHDGSLHSR